MKLNIIDKDLYRLKLLRSYFLEHGVDIIEEDLYSWFKHNNARAIITTSLSDGSLIGDYSNSIDFIFGGLVQPKVKECVETFYNGNQMLGSSFITKIPNSDKYVINSALKEKRGTIENPDYIYQCMKTALICAEANGMEKVLTPVMSQTLMNINPDMCVELMYKAFSEALSTPQEIDNEEYKVKKLFKGQNTVI